MTVISPVTSLYLTTFVFCLVSTNFSFTFHSLTSVTYTCVKRFSHWMFSLHISLFLNPVVLLSTKTKILFFQNSYKYPNFRFPSVSLLTFSMSSLSLSPTVHSRSRVRTGVMMTSLTPTLPYPCLLLCLQRVRTTEVKRITPCVCPLNDYSVTN